MTVKVLPDYVGVANDMGDFFIPDDLKLDEILLRKGLIKSLKHGKVKGLLAATRDSNQKLRMIFQVLLDDGSSYFAIELNHYGVFAENIKSFLY